MEKCLVLMANRLTYMMSTDDCQTFGLRYIRISPDTDPCPSDISSHEFWNVEIEIRNKLDVYNSNFTGQQSSVNHFTSQLRHLAVQFRYCK